MSRKPRIEYEGAFYHVISRGNRKESIFLGDRDRERFLEKLKEYKKRYGFILYSYALMNNHIHLLLETKRAPLSKIMQGILQSHTQWHNRRYNTVGHLFQGRYKAILCDKDSYLLQLVRYIHLNPLRAGIKDPMDYIWTSHRLYLGYNSSELVNTWLVLSQFSRNKDRARRLYKEFICEGLDEGEDMEFYKIRSQRILGDEGFYEEVINITKERVDMIDRIMKEVSLNDVLAMVEKLTGVTKEPLRGKVRNGEVIKARSLFIHLSRLYTKSPGIEIAKYLNREPGALSYIDKKMSTEELSDYLRKLKW